MTLAQTLVKTATAKALKLTTVESCTGGMVAAAITDIAGSSAVFERGVVTYSNAVKTDLVGVLPETLAAHGAVSEEVALEMAQGGLEHAGADIAVAISGIAGPGGSDHKPEGRVCFAIATAEGTSAETIEFGALGRAIVRQKATAYALELMLKAAR